MPASACPHEEDPDRVEALRLAEQALALDPNDPRVHYTLGYMCLDVAPSSTAPRTTSIWRGP